MSLLDESIRRANEALDDLRDAYLADVTARRSHSSEGQARAARLMRAAGVERATVEEAMSWALNGRRIGGEG